MGECKSQAEQDTLCVHFSRRDQSEQETNTNLIITFRYVHMQSYLFARKLD